MNNSVFKGTRCFYSPAFWEQLFGAKRAHLIAAALCTLALNAVANPVAEKIVENSCHSCHGYDGKAKVEYWPNIGCQNRGYLYTKLIEFRRSDEHAIDKRIKNLTTSEIAQLANYYAEQGCPSH